MADQTNISWADHTFNPWIGCQRVSPACDACYAAHLMETRMGRVTWGGPGKGVGTRDRTSEANWKKPLSWDRAAAKAGTRPFVFCSSLADVFDNQVPAAWRKDLFELIIKTPNLVWLLLTKRPQNIVKLFDEISHVRDEWPRNAAIGTTVEDQDRADTNVPALVFAADRLNPAFTFLSCEPLLAEINLRNISVGNDGTLDALEPMRWQDQIALWRDSSPDWEASFMDWFNLSAMPEDGDMHSAIDWVITGGETDQGEHRARPTHPDWFRNLRDQCAATGVPFHHKQNGEFVSVSEVAGPGDHYKFPDGAKVRRIGKKLSGRTIDGVTHDAFPAIRRMP